MRRVFMSPDLTLVITLPRLRALFAQFGWPKGITKSASHRAIARFLFGGVVADSLADALEEIARLASDDGRRALLEGARATKASTAKWPVGEGGAGVAAFVVMAAAKNDRAARRIATRAHIRLNRLYAPRMSYDLAASSPVRDASCDAAIAKGVRAVAGDAADDVWHVRDDDGRLHVALLYAAPSVVEVIDGALTRLRPLRSDVLCVDFEGRRVSVTTATPEWLSGYGEAIGRASWGDPRALLSRPSITFKPPQERGARAVTEAVLPPGVRSIAVTAWLLDAGDGVRTEVRGDGDTLSAAVDRVRMSGGYFRRLNARVVIDGAPHPVDVVMQLPNIVRFSDVRWERQARAAVAAIGLFEPGAVPDDAWTLAPFVHPEWRWRMVLGDAAVNLLLKKKLLTRVATKKVATFAFRALAWSVSTHDVPGEPDVKYAVTDDRSADACDVLDEARVMLKLDVEGARRAMAAAIGAVAATRGKEIAGALDLGEVVTTEGVMRVAYAMTRPAPGLFEELQRACGVRATPVLLVPEGRAVGESSTGQIELSLAEQVGIVDGRELRDRIGERFEVDELRDVVERPIARAADLVVEDKTGRVWLFGVAMTEATPSGEKFIRCLVEAGDRDVSASEAGSYISSRAANPDVVGRAAKKGVDAWVAASFKRAGRAVPPVIAGGLVVTGHNGGYRLVLRGVVR